MTMTLSSATAAAKAAQADITAPVVANNTAASSVAGNSGKNAAGSDQSSANSSNSASSANKANSANGGNGGNGGNTSNAANGSKHTSQASKPASTASGSSQPASSRDQAAAAPAAPLFAQMLNLADVANAAQRDGAGSDSDATDETGSDSAGAGSAAANVLPAMVSSMLNLAPVQTNAAASDSDSDSSTSVDAISATATLRSNATRLNLAAANVAVNPSTQLADDGAAAQVNNAQGGTSQNLFSLANNAALAANPAVAHAAARQLQAATPAVNAADSQAAAAPQADADSDAVALPAVQPGALRVASRSADSAAVSALAAPLAAGAATVKEDSSRSLAANSATVTTVNVAQSASPASGDASTTVKLNGTPEQWQQPLRDALGERLQVQLQRNSEQAVIRLEPPNMGSIEISIRHSAGALTVNLSASNSDVLRQLNTISDGVRQDLSNRQFTDVAVSVSSSRAQSQADQGGRNGQQREQNDGRTPGRALSDDDSSATFAMNGE